MRVPLRTLMQSEQLESDLEWQREDVEHNVEALDISDCGV